MDLGRLKQHPKTTNKPTTHEGAATCTYAMFHLLGSFLISHLKHHSFSISSSERSSRTFFRSLFYRLSFSVVWPYSELAFHKTNTKKVRIFISLMYCSCHMYLSL